jgi:daunorubicin resistance ABC transporter ATP-binding subunit
MDLKHRYGSKKSMFLRRGMFRERLLKIIETFREKGAVSPDSAMTLKELDLPPRFGRLMSGRLGQSGLFIEVNGKYYLSENGVKQIDRQNSTKSVTEDNQKKWIKQHSTGDKMSAVQAEKLTKKFGDFSAVDQVSFSVMDGEVFGFLGPNGAGKTTTINMLCTLMQPTEGKATIGGYDVVREADEVRKKIGVVTEKLIMYDQLTALENLKVFGKLYDVPDQELNRRAEELVKLIDLWDWRNSKVGSFSSGMRQRLNFARALIHNPKILFLDEPTVGLDPATARNIREIIAKFNRDGCTIILTTHQMEVADQLSHRISIIDNGKIIALDTPENLKAKVGPEATLEDVFIELTGSKMRDAPKKERFTMPRRFGMARRRFR